MLGKFPSIPSLLSIFIIKSMYTLLSIINYFKHKSITLEEIYGRKCNVKTGYKKNSPFKEKENKNVWNKNVWL